MHLVRGLPTALGAMNMRRTLLDRFRRRPPNAIFVLSILYVGMAVWGLVRLASDLRTTFEPPSDPCPECFCVLAPWNPWDYSPWFAGSAVAFFSLLLVGSVAAIRGSRV